MSWYRSDRIKITYIWTSHSLRGKPPIPYCECHGDSRSDPLVSAKEYDEKGNLMSSGGWRWWHLHELLTLNEIREIEQPPWESCYE